MLKCGIVVADLVDASDELLDVPSLVPVAHLDLVLLRILIFLSARNRFILAQLKPAADSVGGRQCCREHQSHLESRAPSSLQHWRKNIGSVGEKVRPEVLSHRRLGELGQILTQFHLTVAPCEVCIRLSKAGFRKSLHHLRTRKGLCQKDYFGMNSLYFIN